MSIRHPPYGVSRCTTLTTKAPLSGRARARVSGKRNRASGSVVYPEFHTTNTSSPITGIQWKRTLKSTRSLSLSYCTNASRLVRVLKSYSNRLADNTAVNAPTGRSALVRVRSVLTMRWPPPRHAAVSSRSRSEEHTSELQSLAYLVCRLLLEKKNKRATRFQCAH